MACFGELGPCVGEMGGPAGEFKGDRSSEGPPPRPRRDGGWEAGENEVRERAVVGVGGGLLLVRRPPGLGPGERGRGVDSAPQAGWSGEDAEGGPRRLAQSQVWEKEGPLVTPCP